MTDDPEQPSHSPWDISGAAYEVRLPGILRENHRFARQVKRDAREDRLQWAVTPVAPQRWTLTKTGTRTASHIEVRSRTRRRSPLRQMLTAAAAALQLVPRDVVDPVDVLVATHDAPLGAGDTMTIVGDPAARWKTLVIDWRTQPDSPHHLALKLPRHRGIPRALLQPRDGV